MMTGVTVTRAMEKPDTMIGVMVLLAMTTAAIAVQATKGATRHPMVIAAIWPMVVPGLTDQPLTVGVIPIRMSVIRVCQTVAMRVKIIPTRVMTIKATVIRRIRAVVILTSPIRKTMTINLTQTLAKPG
jgi:hypothetical protein